MDALGSENGEAEGNCKAGDFLHLVRTRINELKATDDCWIHSTFWLTFQSRCLQCYSFTEIAFWFQVLFLKIFLKNFYRNSWRNSTEIFEEFLQKFLKNLFRNSWKTSTEILEKFPQNFYKISIEILVEFLHNSYRIST